MHVRRAFALAAVVPLLLAGCTDDPVPTPKIPEPTTSSATPIPSESETAEAESAEDFIRRWVEVSNQMQSSGDIVEYLQLSARCAACKDVAQRVHGAFDAGGFVQTEGWTIRDISDVSGEGKRRTLDVRVKSAPTVFKESDSSKEERFPGGDLTYRFRLNTGTPWTLLQLTQVAS